MIYLSIPHFLYIYYFRISCIILTNELLLFLSYTKYPPPKKKKKITFIRRHLLQSNNSKSLKTKNVYILDTNFRSRLQLLYKKPGLVIHLYANTYISKCNFPMNHNVRFSVGLSEKCPKLSEKIISSQNATLKRPP